MPSAPPPAPPDAVDRMGTDRPFPLLLKFSLPAIAGMLVTSLYNIVDRMFLGHGPGIGAAGIAGVTVSFPLMMAMGAFSQLVGVGANTLFSIRMGEGRRDQAEKILGNAVSLLVGIPLLACVAFLFCLGPVLTLCGASPDLMPYARPYALIVIAASPLVTTGHGLSHFIRSDGHPVISMIAMILGAVLNTILDWLFIFVFEWGIEGAAWATAIGQLSSFLWCFLYFLRPAATTRLRRSCLAPDLRRIILPFLALGFTPFAMALANSLLNVVLNRSLSRYGGDNALAVMGVISSYMSIIFMPTFGISQGAQPLMGYNYGARLFPRVRDFYTLASRVTTVFMILGWLVSQLFPRQIFLLFLDAGDPLLDIGPHALRFFSAAFPLIGLSCMAAPLFQAIGKPIQAGFISLARQLLLFVPFMLILPPICSLAPLSRFLTPLDGVYLAAPASDLLTCVIALLMVRSQLREFASS